VVERHPDAASGAADAGDHGPDRSEAAEPNPAVELTDVLREAVGDGVLTPGDAELIAASRIVGTPLAEIAHRRGTKLRTLQWRRKRAEALLVAAGSAA
jgi:hypothetical protein